MSTESSSKVQARHLSRNAYLYVRQSTLRQVFENTESTKRQYALQQRAIALGWRIEQVVVIDSDLGRSGASAVDREGFQRLVTEVGLGRAGIVMGLEVSRLARNSTDWHRLLEIRACRHPHPRRRRRVRPRALQRPLAAGLEGDHERGGAACAQGPPAWRHLEQGAPR